MTEPRKLRVFLCHASQDKPVVRELYQRLLAEGWIDPWLDEEKLFPGQDWDLEIKIAVEDADVVIICISNSSVEKEGYVQKELRFALDLALEKPERAIFIIPLRLDDCTLPKSLQSYHYQDYFPDKKRDKAFSRLQKSLESRAHKIGLPIKELREQYLRDLKIKRDMLKRMSAKIRILLVDDDKNWLKLLKMMVTHIGYEVNAVDSLEEFKSELQNSLVNQNPYSIVLADMRFDLNGIEINLGKEIVGFTKNNFPNIECAFITGNYLDSMDVMCLRDDYDVAYVLSKSEVDADMLTQMIKRMIARIERDW